jgi:glycosyltransferase involved in cell wall biosynthesis
MARQTNLFTKKKIGITPFGVNTTTFAPREKATTDEVVFGIIKTMDDLYGLPTILQAFKLVLEQHPEKNFRLRVVGTGPQLEEYKTMSATLGIQLKVDFVGRVDHSLIADEHHKIDIYLNPSQRESFGVSVVEAMACGKSVIVTDVGGLPEVVNYGDCGMIVPVNDANALADAMLHLAEHLDLRKSLGEKGRTFVLANYNWERNVTTMEELAYRKFDQKR